MEPGVRRRLSPQGAATSSSPARSIARSASCRHAASISTREASLHEVDFYTSHEALLLDYEEASPGRTHSPATGTTARPTCSGSASAPVELDGAHVEFLRGVENPIGLQGRPYGHRRRRRRTLRGPQPRRSPGPPHAHHAHGRRQDRDRPSAPPRGGQGQQATRWSGRATRCTATPSPPRRPQDPPLRLDRRRDRRLLRGTREAGTIAGGIHLELTGDAVTECLGGGDDLVDDDLARAYETMCDPRLNGRQGLDVAFRVAEIISQRSNSAAS